MDSKFAIFDLGLSGNVAKPVAMALAVCGSMAAPGVQIEKPRQAAAQPDLHSPPAPSPAPGIAMAVSRAGLAEDVSRSAIKHDRSETAITLPAPVASSQLSDVVRKAPAGAQDKVIARDTSAFASEFAVLSGPEEKPAIVEQVLNPEPVKVPEAPRVAEDEVIAPTPAQLSPPMEITTAQALKIADLTAYDPAAKPAANLVEAAPEKQATPASGAAAIDFVAVPVVQPTPAEPRLVDPAPVQIRTMKPEPASAPAVSPKPKALPKVAATPKAPLAGIDAISFNVAAKLETKVVSAPKAATKLAARTATIGKTAYRLHEDVIDFALPVRLNGEDVGSIPLRVTRDDRLWVRLGDLLTLIRSQMNPEEFERLSASSASSEYMDFEAVRRAGIALQYDSARNRIDLGRK